MAHMIVTHMKSCPLNVAVVQIRADVIGTKNDQIDQYIKNKNLLVF